MDHNQSERREQMVMERGDSSKIITSTKRGERGRTSLLSGERVSKTHPRVEACGNLDEANAALGLAKALSRNDKIRDLIGAIQRDLVLLGAEVSSTKPRSDVIGEERIVQLERWIEELQKEVPVSRQFIDPGTNPGSAALDMARSVVRRSERSIVALQEAGELNRIKVLSYLDQLGFLLYIMARYAEKYS